MHIEKIPLNKIELNTGQIQGLPKNPRFIKDARYKKLLQSLTELPSMMDLREVIVFPFNDKYVAIGGNMRVRGCSELKWEEVPCKVLDPETSIAVLKEIAIKDNNGYGEDDWSALITDWDVNDLINWGVEVPDKHKPAPEVEEDNYDIPEDIQTDIVVGDLFEIGKHRLLCGDSTNKEAVSKLMNGEKADMVFTDPPWNVNYGAVEKGNSQGYKPRTIMNDKMSTGDFKDFMSAAFQIMAVFSKDGCPTYVVMSPQEWGNLMLALFESDYHWSSTIIWVKDHLVLSRKDYHTQYEPIWYGWKNGAARLCPVTDRKQSDTWNYDRPRVSELHPTTKPVGLVANAIKNSSKEGDLVLELFTGSGTTIVAAEQMGRKCYGMELDPKYTQVIVDRMLALDPALVVKKNGEPYIPAPKAGK
jgi:DNA modification methylase